MILAIETATEICSTALVQDNIVLYAHSVNEKNIHSEQLMTLIDDSLKQSALSLDAIKAIAVSIGPGSFTGLRIGLSTAKGLAFSLDVPMIAVPTLDGIAEQYRLENGKAGAKRFCSLIDAKREEAFYAFYSIAEYDIKRESEYSIKAKREIIPEASRYGANIQQPKITASSIGLLAERRQKELKVTDYFHLEPFYLRDFVATVAKNKILH